MKIALTTHILTMAEDHRTYDAVHGGYIQLIEKLGHTPYLAPDISDEKIMSGFLDFIDGMILTGSDYLPEFSEGTLEKDSFDFKEHQRGKLWIDLARKKKKPLLALGDGFFLLNEALGGKNNIDEGMWPGRINIDEELGHTLGFTEVEGILSPSKIMTLGEGLDKINKDTNVLAYRGENILGFALYPEFQIGDEEKILRYFVEKL